MITATTRELKVYADRNEDDNNKIGTTTMAPPGDNYTSKWRPLSCITPATALSRYD